MIKYFLSSIFFTSIFIYTYSQNYVSEKFDYCETDVSNQTYFCSVHELNSTIVITENELQISNSEFIKVFQISSLSTENSIKQYTLIDPSGELAFLIIQAGEATIHYDQPGNNPVYRFYLH